MEQRESLPQVLAANLAPRARNFQHDALAQLFELAFDDAYELAFALTGDHDSAGAAVQRTFERLLDRLPEYHGESAALAAWVLAAVAEQVRLQPRPHAASGVREGLARLPRGEHEALSLRLIAGLEPAIIAAVTGRRYPSVLAAEMGGLRALRGEHGLGLALPAAQRQLDAALHHLIGGASAAEAATWAPALPDGRAMLEAAAGVTGLAREPAPAATRARIRNHFLAAGDERRANWFHRNYTPAEVPGHRPRPHRGVSTAAALLMACALAIAAGVLMAVSAAFATPSSPAYPLKRLGEDVLVGLTLDRVAKADLEVKLSEERLKEAETEAGLKHGDAAVGAEQAHFDELRSAAADLAAVRHRDARWKATRDRFESQASQPVDQLERLLSSNGLKAQAQQVARANQRFQTDRQALDKALGVTATTNTPLTQPSAGPVPPAGG